MFTLFLRNMWIDWENFVWCGWEVIVSWYFKPMWVFQFIPMDMKMLCILFIPCMVVVCDGVPVWRDDGGASGTGTLSGDEGSPVLEVGSGGSFRRSMADLRYESPLIGDENLGNIDLNKYNWDENLRHRRIKRHSRYRKNNQFPENLVVKFEIGPNITGSAVIQPVLPTVSMEEFKDNQRGAMIFAAVVVSLYGLSIGLLIGSSMRRDEAYEEVRCSGDRDKMAAIFQTAFSKAFSSINWH